MSILLDAHKTRIALGNRPKAAQLDPRYNTHPKIPTLFNLLNDTKENVLAKRGIIIKISSGDYHRELGLSERIVFNIKQLLISTFRGKVISSYFDYIHFCGLLEYFINRRPTLDIDSNILTPYSYEEFTLDRSNVPVDHNFTFSDNVFPTAVER